MTLTELADRVERLTGPCRETDCLIFELGHRLLTPERRGTIDGEPTGEYFGLNGGLLPERSPFYTASRDAAMTLRLDWMSVETVESAPEPKFTRCRVWDWRRSPTMSDPGNEWKAEGNRPLPVNICSAILRARAALESSHGR